MAGRKAGRRGQRVRAVDLWGAAPKDRPPSFRPTGVDVRVGLTTWRPGPFGRSGSRQARRCAVWVVPRKVAELEFPEVRYARVGSLAAPIPADRGRSAPEPVGDRPGRAARVNYHPHGLTGEVPQLFARATRIMSSSEQLEARMLLTREELIAAVSKLDGFEGGSGWSIARQPLPVCDLLAE